MEETPSIKKQDWRYGLQTARNVAGAPGRCPVRS